MLLSHNLSSTVGCRRPVCVEQGEGGGWRVRIKANIFLQFLIGQERGRERERDLNVGISREKSFQIKSHIIPFIPAAAAANTAIGTELVFVVVLRGEKSIRGID